MRITSLSLSYLGFLLAFSMACSSCKSKKHAQSAEHSTKHAPSELSVSLAEVQHWSSGVKQGGSGYEYFIELKFTGHEEPRFDTLWLDGSRAVETYKGKTQGANEHALTLRATETYNPQETTLTQPKSGRLAYTLKGQRYYLSITEFKQRNAPNRP